MRAKISSTKMRKVVQTMRKAKPHDGKAEMVVWKDQLILTTTSLGTTVTFHLDFDEVNEIDGERHYGVGSTYIIDLKHLSSTLGGSNSVSIELDGDTVGFNGSHYEDDVKQNWLECFEFNIPHLNPDNRSDKVTVRNLKPALDYVYRFMNKDGRNPVMNSVCLRDSMLLSTNNKSLSTYALDVNDMVNMDGMIDLETVRALRRVMGKRDEVTWQGGMFNENEWFAFTGEIDNVRWSIETMCGVGSFPDTIWLRDKHEREIGAFVSVTGEQLKAAYEDLNVTDEEFIRIEACGDDTLRLISLKSSEHSSHYTLWNMVYVTEGDVQSSVDNEGSFRHFYVKGNGLKDVIKAIDHNATVAVGIEDEESPIVFRDSEGGHIVSMPYVNVEIGC